MLDKPSNAEDEYFAREDIEKKRKLAFQQGQALAAQQREALKKQHYMKCPKCGFDLHTLKHGEVEVDTCFHCKGVWLDAGELEHLQADMKRPVAQRPVLEAILNIFKHG